MPAYRFRFDNDALRTLFAPRKPRNPLLRVAFGLLGLGLLLVLVVFGVFIGAAMLAGGLLMRLWHSRDQHPARRPQAGKRVVDGEYRVVGKSALPLGH
jgi:UPF0716 family protein affecting phage T7 exclusion